MSRYFFDLVDHNVSTRDEIGDDFDSADEARDNAQAILGQVMLEHLPNGEAITCTCQVRDERDIIVYRASIIFETCIDKM